MAENRTLIRFLRAKNHDLDQAEAMIQDTLNWRAKWKMDTILEENWNKWMKIMPFQLQIYDKDMRPAIAANMGQVNVRKIVLSGKQETLDRYIVYAFEMGQHRVKTTAEKTGKGFVTGYLLFSLAGYNPRTHACLTCLRSWVRLVQNYENHYPQLCQGIYLVNTPAVFQTILDLVRPYLTFHTSKVLKIYGLDKSEWRDEMLKVFPENLLTPEFGGKGPVIYAKPIHDPKNVKVIN